MYYLNRKIKTTRFSLIEVLVVFATLSILLSLLQPSLARTLSISKTQLCASNLKHWGVLFELYSEDYDGELPNANYPGWHRNMDVILERPTVDYEIGQGKGFGIFECPENEVQRRPAGHLISELDNSYQPNGFNNAILFLSSNKYRHENPSQLYALFDGMYYRTEVWKSDGMATEFTSGIRSVRYVHSKGLNMLYADGHVDWLPPVLENRGGYLGGSGPSSFTNGVHWYAY